ncbi:MAG: HAD-IIA family hydrolase [Acidimicrobiia bacterium]
MSESSDDNPRPNASNGRIEGIIFDIDGTVARGRQVLPGALETLAQLRNRSVPFAFFTNDNSMTVGTWIERLGDMGIPAERSEIVTSAIVAAEVMAELHATSRILGVGDPGLLEALTERNLNFVGFDSTEPVDAVVMGRDSNFDPQRLNAVCQAIWGGAEFFATNYDPRLPVAGGFAPGTGAMVKAVAYATGQEPIVTGKPSPWSGKMAARVLGVPPEQGLVIGDQIATDIAMGRNAGMHTVLVLTGTAKATDLDGVSEAERPHTVLESIADLIPWLDEHG